MGRRETARLAREQPGKLAIRLFQVFQIEDAKKNDHGPAHADAKRAGRLAPTWQEIAETTRPYLPGLPAPGREAYARAVLDKIVDSSYMTFLPAPFQYPGEFQRALVTKAYAVLERGGRLAAIRQNPDGTYEVTDIRVPPIRPWEYSSPVPAEPVPVTAPARRPALRLVHEPHGGHGTGTRTGQPRKATRRAG